MNSNFNYQWLVYVLIFFLGYFIGGGSINIEGWSFKKELDPLQLVSIILSVVLFVYIALRIDKSKERSKAKKDIIIKKSDAVISIIHEFSRKVSSGNIPYNETAPALKEIYTNFSSFNCFVNKCALKNSLFKKEFESAYLNLRNLATLTPKKGSETNIDIYIKDKYLCYGSQRTGEIRRELNKMEEVLVSEQIRVIDI